MTDRPDDRNREHESPKPAEPAKGSDESSDPTAAEQMDVEEAIADELSDDRFQASDN
jgi:hypothetical protein